MMRPSTIRTLRPKLYQDVETEIVKRSIVSNKWETQGTTYFYKQIEDFIYQHLQNFYQNDQMNLNEIFNYSNKSLIIFLSLSADGSRLGPSASSFHFSVLVSVIMDVRIWKSTVEYQVKKPLPLLLCNDSETVDVLFWIGEKICEAINSSTKSIIGRFTKKKFCSLYSRRNEPILRYQRDSSEVPCCFVEWRFESSTSDL